MRDRRRMRPGLPAAALLVAGGLAGTAGLSAVSAGASTNSATTWVGTSTRAMTLSKATLIGKTDSARKLTIRAVLKFRNETELNKRIASSAKALTPSEFRTDFGPTKAQVSSVRSYLSKEGFKDISATSNGLLVSATGTVAQVEKAFDTSLKTFTQLGHQVYANVTAARVPASLSHTVGAVLGLNDIVGMHSPLKTTADTKPSLSTGTPQYDVSYRPIQFAGIYGATSSTPTGGKTAIGIIAEGDLTQVVKDLRLAEKASNLPEVPVTIVHAGIASSDTSGMDEWDMDTQSSTGIARSVKALYLYDATSLTDSDLALAIDKFAAQDAVRAASASLGECETLPYLDGSMLADDEAFAEAAAQGQSFFASSGDTGPSCAVTDTNGVPDSGPPNTNYPASSPYVTAVGGTTLLTTAKNAYDEEIAWNAGGGGSSVWETAPAWQDGVVPGSTAGKGVPDIAMDADPYSGVTLFIDGTEQEGYGGTSLSSPLALGVWARLESGHGNSLGMASPDLYDTYDAGSCTSAEVTNVCSTAAFHDITLGTNGGFAATPGWDYTTGLGSFDIAEAEQLIKK